jgi:hypothetical protein
VTSQCLEKRLKAAEDPAAYDRAFDLNVADSGRALNLVDGWVADETHLNSLDRQLFGHARQPRRHAFSFNPWNC